MFNRIRFHTIAAMATILLLNILYFLICLKSAEWPSHSFTPTQSKEKGGTKAAPIQFTGLKPVTRASLQRRRLWLSDDAAIRAAPNRF